MSSFTFSAIAPRIANALKRSLYASGLSLAIATLCSPVHAGCQYLIEGDWGNGFGAKIRITNDGNTPIDGWSVSWQYAGNNRMTSNYNAIFSGSNPYTATNLSWNRVIQPNQSVEFGVQGTKSTGAPEIPVVSGSACGGTTSSVAPSSSSRSSSSIAPSSSSRSSSSIAPSSSSRSSSSVATAPAWTLDSTASYLNFVSTKNTHNVEVHDFTSLRGEISTTGVATLTIDLSSANTGVSLRDERLRDLLFQVTSFPTATVTVAVPSTLISGLAAGQSTTTEVSASLNLHGVTGTVITNVSVQKLSANRVLVQSLSPILIKASDYALTDGVEALRAAVGIASISISVPVDFALVFDAR